VTRRVQPHAERRGNASAVERAPAARPGGAEPSGERPAGAELRAAAAQVEPPVGSEAIECGGVPPPCSLASRRRRRRGRASESLDIAREGRPAASVGSSSGARARAALRASSRQSSAASSVPGGLAVVEGAKRPTSPSSAPRVATDRRRSSASGRRRWKGERDLETAGREVSRGDGGAMRGEAARGQAEARALGLAGEVAPPRSGGSDAAWSAGGTGSAVGDGEDDAPAARGTRSRRAPPPYLHALSTRLNTCARASRSADGRRPSAVEHERAPVRAARAEHRGAPPPPARRRGLSASARSPRSSRENSSTLSISRDRRSDSAVIVR
jgi:hypothetical protein